MSVGDNERIVALADERPDEYDQPYPDDDPYDDGPDDWDDASAEPCGCEGCTSMRTQERQVQEELLAAEGAAWEVYREAVLRMAPAAEIEPIYEAWRTTRATRDEHEQGMGAWG